MDRIYRLRLKELEIMERWLEEKRRADPDLYFAKKRTKEALKNIAMLRWGHILTSTKLLLVQEQPHTEMYLKVKQKVEEVWNKWF